MSDKVSQRQPRMAIVEQLKAFFHQGGTEDTEKR